MSWVNWALMVHIFHTEVKCSLPLLNIYTPSHFPINPRPCAQTLKPPEQLVRNVFLVYSTNLLVSMCSSLSHYKWSDLKIMYYSWAYLMPKAFSETLILHLPHLDLEEKIRHL